MTEARYDILAIGNAIVDVIANTDDEFLVEEQLTKGGMMLVDEDRAEALYGAMGPAREISGGSAANTLAGMSMLGQQCALVAQVADEVQLEVEEVLVDLAAPAPQLVLVEQQVLT